MKSHAPQAVALATAVRQLEELLEAIPNLERDTSSDVEFWGWGFRGPTTLHTVWEV